MKIRITALGIAVALGTLASLAHDPAWAGRLKKPTESAQQRQPQHALNPKVAKALRAARESLEKEEWDAAYAHVQEAQAVPGKSAYDEFQIAESLGYTEIKRQHYPEAAAAFEQAIASGMLSPAETTARLRTVAQLALQSKDYPRAVQFAKKAIESTANPDPELHALLGQGQYLTADYKAAAENLARAVEGAHEANQPIVENWLQFEMGSYVRLKDEAGLLRALEQLAIAFPKKQYLQDVFREWRRQHVDERAILNLHRLMHELGLLEYAEDYLRMAQLAVAAGMPGEAVRVLEQGQAKKVFVDKVDAEGARRELETAKTAAAADRNALQALEQSAGEKTGEDEVQLGLALLSFGEYARAAEALQRGLAKGGIKRPDQAQLQLGQALVKLNRAADAKAAFENVDASSRLHTVAQLWEAYTSRPPAEAEPEKPG